MTPGDARLDRDLDDLREAYRRRLPEQLAGLGAQLRNARHPEIGNEREREELDAVRDLTHRLRGTSGSYGFDATSVALGRIEASVARLLEEPAPDRAGIWKEIDESLCEAQAKIGK